MNVFITLTEDQLLELIDRRVAEALRDQAPVDVAAQGYLITPAAAATMAGVKVKTVYN
ncbi:MAG TPA: hypothetical protein VNJ51_13790 [Candidatus Dormibacteraeota bacterium]|nr:hypothetical protein [Candidatus Dormibacteraeota bacterium]